MGEFGEILFKGTSDLGILCNNIKHVIAVMSYNAFISIIDEANNAYFGNLVADSLLCS